MLLHSVLLLFIVFDWKDLKSSKGKSILEHNLPCMTLKNTFLMGRGLRKVMESHGIIVTKCLGKSGNPETKFGLDL